MMQHHLYLLCHGPDLWGFLVKQGNEPLFMCLHVDSHGLVLLSGRWFGIEHLAQWERRVCEPFQLSSGLSMCTFLHGWAGQLLSPAGLHWTKGIKSFLCCCYSITNQIRLLFKDISLGNKNDDLEILCVKNISGSKVLKPEISDY